MTHTSVTANRKHSAAVWVITERQNRLSLESLERAPNHLRVEPRVQCEVQNQKAALPCGPSVTDR